VKIDLLDETQRFRSRPRLLQALARVGAQVIPAKRHAHASWTIVLVGDRAMARLNQRDRGVRGPTDVLAYPTHEPDDVAMPRVAHLGDVVISLDTAAAAARAAHHPLWHEVAMLAAHGLLHLEGYDHTDDAAWAPFHAAAAATLKECQALDAWWDARRVRVPR
jgi:probable rRNA maturation factor